MTLSLLPALDSVVLQTESLTDPSTEQLVISIVFGLVVGSAMAYHAHTVDRNPIVWGLVGFFFNIIGAIIYAIYLYFASPPTEAPDQLEPRPEITESEEFGGQSETTTRESTNQTSEAEASAQHADDENDNQWREIAREVESGGTAESTTGTEPTTETGWDTPREDTVDTGPTTSAPDASARQTEISEMAVELTYGDGKTDVRSGVTGIRRDGNAVVITAVDGTEATYERARIERVWTTDE